MEYNTIYTIAVIMWFLFAGLAYGFLNGSLRVHDGDARIGDGIEKRICFSLSIVLGPIAFIIGIVLCFIFWNKPSWR